MSTADTRPRARRWADRAARVVLPLGVFCVVLAVFFGEQRVVDHELQLVLPASAPPGQDVAAQALIFAGIGRLAGPHIEPGEVRVEWRHEGSLVAEQRLPEAVLGGAAGVLRTPSREGVYEVRALAGQGAEPVATATASVEIRADAPPASREGRLSRVTQRLRLGPIDSVDGIPPRGLDVRVVGGACAPETPCALLVHVGDPPAQVRLAETASVTPEPPEPGESSGLQRLGFVTHGPEAETTLEVMRSGVVVARRTLQLPVTLATPGLVVSPLSADGSPTLEVHTLSPQAIVIDAYQDGFWRRCDVRAAPGADEGARFAWTPPALEPGVWRLQVRTDPFSADFAAVRYVLVAAPGEGPEVALEALESTLAAAGRSSLTPPGPLDRQAEWLLAGLEEDVASLPTPVSGRAADEAEVASQQATLRGAALLAVVLGLIVITLLLVRRGVDSAHEAQRVMDATGDPELTSRAHRHKLMLSTMALVATILLAFVAAAALVIVRARLLS